MKQYKNKVAVITGGSAGIGSAIVKSLALAGMKVVGLARRKEKLDELIKQIKSKKKFGKSVKIYAVKADITKEEEITQAFKWVTENIGPIYVLINNAGIMVNNDIIDGDTQEWKKVMDTNVLGLTIATKEAIKIMTQNKIDGHIINVNSLAGHLVPNFPKLNVYSASKYAVTAVTETFRVELLKDESKIKITSLSPGYVETELTQANNLMAPEEVKAIFQNFKPLESVDIANAVLYILDTPPHVQVKELIIIPTAQPI